MLTMAVHLLPAQVAVPPVRRNRPDVLITDDPVAAASNKLAVRPPRPPKLSRAPANGHIATVQIAPHRARRSQAQPAWWAAALLACPHRIGPIILIFRGTGEGTPGDECGGTTFSGIACGGDSAVWLPVFVSHVGGGAQLPSPVQARVDPPAGDPMRNDPQPTEVRTRSPRLHPGAFGPFDQLGAVLGGDFLGLAPYQHTPPRAGPVIDVIGFEGDVPVVGGQQFRAGPGTEMITSRSNA